MILPRTPGSAIQARIDEFAKAGVQIVSGVYKDSLFNIEPDFIAFDAKGKRTDKLAWTHRAGNDFDIYFVSNQLDSAREVELSFRISNKAAEIWDPLTVSINAASWKLVKRRTIVSTKLAANGSIFIVFRKGTTAAKAKPFMAAQTISGPWKVKFSEDKQVTFNTLSDWSKNADSTVRYFSGTAVYSNNFNWQGTSQSVWLNVGKVANIAEIFVNGISCGIAWTAPYCVNITKALRRGNNLVTIEVSNTWANRLIGDHNLPPEKRVTNTIAPYRLEGKPLLPAGLLGPVTIEVQR